MMYFCGYSGFNVEMGVVIGEGGRDISIEDAEAYRWLYGSH